MQTEKMHVIARIHSEFPEKFGIPRQSGLVPGLRARIVFEPEFRNPDALRGIELICLGDLPIVEIADNIGKLFPFHSSKPSSFK